MNCAVLYVFTLDVVVVYFTFLGCTFGAVISSAFPCRVCVGCVRVCGVWGRGLIVCFCHQKFHSFLMSCISSLVLTNFIQAACGRTVKALAWVSEDRRFETTWVQNFFFSCGCECVWCGVVWEVI